MKFINRTKELQALNSLWEQKKSQLVVIYGKRRVGKTELIKQFIKDGKGIYYLADKRTHQEQLVEFSRVVGNYFEDEFMLRNSFSDWLEAFIYIKQKARKKQFVIAIDEYPYLAETESSISSVIQKAWDEHLKDTKAFLILCGSSIAMMESELLSYKAPLFGRLTGQLNIQSMDYEASKIFFPRSSFTDFISYYSISGGMPAYMEQMSQYKTVTEAVTNLCWDKQGLYHNEINYLLKQELRVPNKYFAILKAIAYGKTKLNEISQDSGLEPQLVNKYLDTLQRLQLIKREVPVTEDKPHKSKSGMYVLTENFVRFWFQYVYAFSSDLEIGNLKQAKAKFKQFSNILEAIAYEDVARAHMLQIQDKLFSIDRVGRYWDKNVEIDGVGLNSQAKQIVFMEAKWSNSKQDVRTLNKLREKSKLVPWHKDKRRDFYVIYSKSGFTADLLNINEVKVNLVLVHQDKVVI